MALVVGASSNSNSAAVAFCFPLFLFCVLEVGGDSGGAARVRWGCDAFELFMSSESWLCAFRVLRESPSFAEEMIIRSCSALYYPGGGTSKIAVAEDASHPVG